MRWVCYGGVIAHTAKRAALDRSRGEISIDACLAWRLLCTLPIVEKISWEIRLRGRGVLSCGVDTVTIGIALSLIHI